MFSLLISILKWRWPYNLFDYLFKGILSDNEDINPYIETVPKTSKLNLDLKFLYPARVFDVDFPGKPKEIIQALLNAKKLKNIIIENNIDLIHVNGTPIIKWLCYVDGYMA